MAFFEAGRGELKSKEWYERQIRKINGVLKVMDELVTAKKGELPVGSELSIANIAAGAILGMANMLETKFGMIEWEKKYPDLVEYWEMLEESKRELQGDTAVYV